MGESPSRGHRVQMLQRIQTFSSRTRQRLGVLAGVQGREGNPQERNTSVTAAAVEHKCCTEKLDGGSPGPAKLRNASPTLLSAKCC